MLYSEMNDVQKKSIEELGVHIRDTLGVLNVALKNGAISHDDWSKFLDGPINTSFNVFNGLVGVSVDDVTKVYIKKILAT